MIQDLLIIPVSSQSIRYIPRTRVGDAAQSYSRSENSPSNCELACPSNQLLVAYSRGKDTFIAKLRPGELLVTIWPDDSFNIKPFG